MNRLVLPEQVGKMAASQILALEGSQICFETAFRVVDDPVMPALVKHIPLRGMPTSHGIGRRIDFVFGKQLRKTRKIERSDELNHAKDHANFTWRARTGRAHAACSAHSLCSARCQVDGRRSGVDEGAASW